MLEEADIEVFDVINLCDEPSMPLKDSILESITMSHVDGTVGRPPLMSGESEDAMADSQSLFSELVEVEDERVKDRAFQEMAERLHVSLTNEASALQTDDLEFLSSESVHPKCSSPLITNYHGQPSERRPSTACGNEDVHPAVDQSFSSFCENDYSDMSVRSVSNLISVPTNSPLYGKEREMASTSVHDMSHSHAEEDDMHMDAMYQQIQKCMVSMVDISCRLNNNNNNNNSDNQQIDLQEKLVSNMKLFFV